jgi:hypothetical protein
MAENKKKFALWMSPETRNTVREMFESDNCKSQSEFIEKAVRFYAGYIGAQKSGEYLPRALTFVMRGMFDDFENRIARLLFKLAVEQAIMRRVLAAAAEIDAEYLKKLRAECVEEVKRTNGGPAFERSFGRDGL